MQADLPKEKLCSTCESTRPADCFYVRDVNHPTLKARLQSSCIACLTSGGYLAGLKRSGTPIEAIREMADDYFAKRALGIKGGDIRQRDISVEAHRIGVEPGRIRVPLPPLPEAPPISRQQRRAAERAEAKAARRARKKKSFEEKLAALDANSRARAKGGKRVLTKPGVEHDADAISRNLNRLQNGLCPYTGLDLKAAADTENPLLQPSKDQRKAGDGYTVAGEKREFTNAVLTPVAFNYLKNQYTEQEAIEALKVLAQSLIDTGRWQPRLRQFVLDV